MQEVGVKVMLVEGRDKVLGFLDHEICEAFQYHMRQMGMTLRLGEKVASVTMLPEVEENGPSVEATLESGKVLRAQTLLFAVGRQGTTKVLGLDKVGLAA